MPKKEDQLNLAKEDINDYYSPGKVWDHYKEIRLLGEGGCGKVFEVSSRDPHDKLHYALKEVDKSSYDLDVLEREIILLKRMNHPNITYLKEAYQSEEMIYLVMELVRGGELFNRIIKHTFSEEDAAEVVKQILSAFAYVHDMGIAHRDLKAENILMVDTTGNHIKVADFGLSNALGEQSKFDSWVGTTDYMAPEILMGEKYTLSVDMWALGVLTFIMLAGEAPFWADSDTKIIEKILAGTFGFTSGAWAEVSQPAKDFISALLQLKVEDRPTAKQALEHPWLKPKQKRGMNRLASCRNLADYCTRNRMKFMYAKAYDAADEDDDKKKKDHKDDKKEKKSEDKDKKKHKDEKKKHKDDKKDDKKHKDDKKKHKKEESSGSESGSAE